MDLAKELKIRNLVINTDSQLVANQVQGSYEVKEQSLKDYKEAVLSAIQNFDSTKINLVKRDHIEKTDALANLGATKNSSQERWIQVSSLVSPSIHKNLEITIFKNDWRNEIIDFIKGIEFKGSKFEERKIKNQAAHYILQDNELYRRETDAFPLRVCTSREEGKELALIIHSGGGGAHQGARRLHLQVSRQGYFWPSMKQDMQEIVKKCSECQKFENLQHRPSIKLTSLNTAVPFARWALDIIGPFQVASKGRKYAFVAIKYFTKWAEAEPVRSIT